MSALTRRVVRFLPYTSPPLVATLAPLDARADPAAILPPHADRYGQISVERSARRNRRLSSARTVCADDRAPGAARAAGRRAHARLSQSHTPRSCGPPRAISWCSRPSRARCRWSSARASTSGRARDQAARRRGRGDQDAGGREARPGRRGDGGAAAAAGPGRGHLRRRLARRLLGLASGLGRVLVQRRRAEPGRLRAGVVVEHDRPDDRRVRPRDRVRSGSRSRSAARSCCSRCGLGGGARGGGWCGAASARCSPAASSCCSCRVRTRPAGRSPMRWTLLVALLQPRHALRPGGRGADRPHGGVRPSSSPAGCASPRRCAAWR